MSEDLSQTIGVTKSVTVGIVIFLLCAPSVGYVYVLAVISLIQNSFSAGDEGRIKLVLRISHAICIISNVALTFASMYLILGALVSPYSYRRVHELCFYMYSGQLTVSYFLFFISALVLAIEARKYLNGVIAARMQ
eukprot:2696022-Pleurochrysis_carterae.AAC.2